MLFQIRSDPQLASGPRDVVRRTMGHFQLEDLRTRGAVCHSLPLSAGFPGRLVLQPRSWGENEAKSSPQPAPKGLNGTESPGFRVSVV